MLNMSHFGCGKQATTKTIADALVCHHVTPELNQWHRIEERLLQARRQKVLPEEETVIGQYLVGNSKERFSRHTTAHCEMHQSDSQGTHR